MATDRCGNGVVREGLDVPEVAAFVAMRFWPLVDIRSPDECWPWRGPVAGKGYGYFGRLRAHRVAYELMVGPIPAGKVIDHRCDNRLCQNPAHLRPLTNRENVLRGAHPNAVAHRTGRCRRGHSLDDAIVKPQGRECRTCRYERERAKRAARAPA